MRSTALVLAAAMLAPLPVHPQAGAPPWPRDWVRLHMEPEPGHPMAYGVAVAPRPSPGLPPGFELQFDCDEKGPAQMALIVPAAVTVSESDTLGYALDGGPVRMVSSAWRPGPRMITALANFDIRRLWNDLGSARTLTLILGERRIDFDVSKASRPLRYMLATCA